MMNMHDVKLPAVDNRRRCDGDWKLDVLSCSDSVPTDCIEHCDLDLIVASYRPYGLRAIRVQVERAVSLDIRLEPSQRLDSDNAVAMRRATQHHFPLSLASCLSVDDKPQTIGVKCLLFARSQCISTDY